jgi:hypothetical protein
MNLATAISHNQKNAEANHSPGIALNQGKNKSGSSPKHHVTKCE